jgi:hypothetical protein
VQRANKHLSKCFTVTSVEALGACFWSGKGHHVPGMLVVECNGLVGVLKQPARCTCGGMGPPLRTAARRCAAGARACLKLLQAAPATSSGTGACKTRVGEDLVLVGQLPALLEAARLSQQLSSAACIAFCGCQEAPSGVRLATC